MSLVCTIGDDKLAVWLQIYIYSEVRWRQRMGSRKWSGSDIKVEEKKKDERGEHGEGGAVLIITSNSVVTVVSRDGNISVNRDNESVTIISQ
jgi:hypothetical protein